MDKVKELVLEVLEKGDRVHNSGKLKENWTFVEFHPKSRNLITIVMGHEYKTGKECITHICYSMVNWKTTAISKIVDLFNNNIHPIGFKSVEACNMIPYSKEKIAKYFGGNNIMFDWGNGNCDVNISDIDIEKTLSEYIEKVKQEEYNKNNTKLARTH